MYIPGVKSKVRYGSNAVNISVICQHSCARKYSVVADVDWQYNPVKLVTLKRFI